MPTSTPTASCSILFFWPTAFSTTCYLVHPYMKDFPDQFWTLFRIPFDILNIADVNGDGYSEIIRYSDPRHSDSTVFAFHDGILTAIPLSK